MLMLGRGFSLVFGIAGGSLFLAFGDGFGSSILRVQYFSETSRLVKTLVQTRR